jgi:ABC-type lipoprotein export system ATPase subunit/CRP-like cAMP-binding protein
VTRESFSFTALAVGQLGALIAIVVIGFARGDLAVGEATAAILYVRAMGDSIAAIPAVVVEMQEAAPYMRRLQRVLNYPERRGTVLDRLSSPTDLDDALPVLQMSGVHFAPADGSSGCHDINLAVCTGEWHAVVGSRRSVRHAVLMAASGLDDLEAGSIYIKGIDVFTVALDDLRSMVSVISADPFIAAASLFDNVALGRLIDHKEVTAALGKAALTPDMFPDGLDTDISSLALSRDIRVRIEIARVIVAQSSVVIIDDPTAQLDRTTATELWSIMRSSFAHRAVLASTVDLERLEPGDLVSVLLSDRIAEQGSLEELARDGRQWGSLWARSRGADDVVELLRSVPSFADLPVEKLDILARRLVTETFHPGEILFTEGDPSDRLLLVEKGSVELVASGRRLATLHDGDHVGDFDHTLDVMSDKCRAFSARAVSFTVVRSLHRSAFSQGSISIVDASPAARMVYRYLARHGAATVDELTSSLQIDGIMVALHELASEHVVIRTLDDNCERWRLSAVSRRSNSSTISRLARIDT